MSEVPLYFRAPTAVAAEVTGAGANSYRGTSLTKNTHPPRITIGPSV